MVAVDGSTGRHVARSAERMVIDWPWHVVAWLCQSTLFSVFLTGVRNFSHQAATQLTSLGWVDIVPDPTLPQKFQGHSRQICCGNSNEVSLLKYLDVCDLFFSCSFWYTKLRFLSISAIVTRTRASLESPMLSLSRFGAVNLPSLPQMFDTLDSWQILQKTSSWGKVRRSCQP